MSDLVSLLRVLIQEEMKQLKLGDIGVVTSIFSHKKDDKNNYECSVKLRETDLELRKVPMATPHIGMASTPNVGDLVMVYYLKGDPNLPIVTGRLYSDKENPPEHEDKAWIVESPYAGGSQKKPEEKTSIAIDKEASIKLTAGKTSLVMYKDGKVELKVEKNETIEIKGKLQVKCEEAKVEVEKKAEVKCKEIKVEASGNAEVKCSDCTIDASGKINLGKGGSGVITEQSHKCYYTGAPLMASKNVLAKG